MEDHEIQSSVKQTCFQNLKKKENDFFIIVALSMTRPKQKFQVAKFNGKMYLPQIEYFT